MQFIPFEKNIEVNGQTVNSIMDGFSLFKKIPSKYLLREGIGKVDGDGIVKLDPDAWYSQEAWLKAFENISKEVGDSTLHKIGLKIPENAQFPPFVKDVESALSAIDIAYHMNHRKNGQVMFDPQTGKMEEGIGHYGYEKISGQNKVICKCENPYPCDFDKGIITTMAGKFSRTAIVIHDNDKECRKKGANSCTFIVTW